MDTIKKLGLTALAGSMVATSAYAGAMDVTGSASITYQSQDEDEVTGNPYTMGRAITFSGSGDMDNGWNVNYFYIMDDAAHSSSGIVIDMADAGTFRFENGAKATGIMSLQDKIPVAGVEQAYDDMTGDAHGLAALPTSGVLGYSMDMNGFTISANYNKGGSTSTGGVATAATASSSYSGAISGQIADGFEAGIGRGELSGSTADTDETHTTAYVKYAVGGITVAAQRTELDKSANDVESTGLGITFAVNENLSIGTSMLTVEHDQSGKVDQESTEVGASYTMGSMSIAATRAKTDAALGASGTDDKHTEVKLSFAF